MRYYVNFLVYLTTFWLQLLERALEAAGNDMDSAIKSLTDLHLEPEGGINLASVAGTCEDGTPVNTHLATEGICTFSSLGFSLFYRYSEESNALPCSKTQILKGRSGEGRDRWGVKIRELGGFCILHFRGVKVHLLSSLSIPFHYPWPFYLEQTPKYLMDRKRTQEYNFFMGTFVLHLAWMQISPGS